MSSIDLSKDESGAAIVCSHAASGQSPILYAERSEPIDDADSGWQFACNPLSDENPKLAQVWSINEVLVHEPTLRGLLEMPAGTRLIRESSSVPWRVEQ